MQIAITKAADFVKIIKIKFHSQNFLATTVHVLQHVGHFLLSILLQSLQPLEQSVPKRFSVTWTQRVKKRVRSLVILGAQILVDLIEGIAHHLFGRMIYCQNQQGL